MPTLLPERTEFERLVRDALARCYDRVALETHPLAAYLPRTPVDERSRGVQMRAALERAVEALRPGDGEPQAGAPGWRPYLLVRGRYLEGIGLQELQAQLALSERQLRREHGRALEAIVTGMWDRFFPGQPLGTEVQIAEAPPGDSEQSGFPANLCSLELADVLEGVINTLQRRAEAESILLAVRPVQPHLCVVADRVLLRQVLLTMLSYALGVLAEGPLVLQADADGERAIVQVSCLAGDPAVAGSPETDKFLEKARYWAGQIDADLTLRVPASCPGCVVLELALPLAGRPVLLVVDDQETAFRMFQRYLKHTPLRLIGLRDGRELAPVARELQPAAITLDIMMPNMDGWEVLQSLQADPALRHIPVIVCSVWEDPELAASLGAADFLKKPVMQQDLLAALARLHLLETWAG